MLRPVFESYLLVADALVARDFRVDADIKRLVAETLALGGQYQALSVASRVPKRCLRTLFEAPSASPPTADYSPAEE